MHLPREARVLDLGSREGSFPADAYSFLTVQVDLNRPKVRKNPFIQADAVRLPFPSRTFDAVILNHSVEHFVQLKPALQEIGRVVKREGAAVVAVPDATTLTDRIYRKLFRGGGGHVNLFDSASELEGMLAWYLGLPHVATRTLYSSFSFMNRKNTQDPILRRIMRFRGLWEPALAFTTAGSRVLDRMLHTRTSVYGWAFYFGRVGEPVDSQASANVCIRCGEARPSTELQQAAAVRRRWLIPYYQCPSCGASNIFTTDRIE